MVVAVPAPAASERVPVQMRGMSVLPAPPVCGGEVVGGVQGGRVVRAQPDSPGSVQVLGDLGSGW